ncbi:MAG: hypothetical protein JSS82_12855 [Bacteroidetes bacterium]|nr:hypothetical protein [Bacteroidota bacterium]
MKQVKGNIVFIAAVITEILVIVIYCCNLVYFLWPNVIGRLTVGIAQPGRQ